MKDRLFYQDFLYRDMVVDKDDYPDVELKYCDDVANCICVEPGTDIKGLCGLIQLSQLMNIRNEEKWILLEESISKLKKIIIEDDIYLQNSELEEYKIFFLKTYFWRFRRCCNECYIKSRQTLPTSDGIQRIQ